MTPRRRFYFMALFPLLILGMGGVVMWLWNAILPEVSPLKPLSYWQALGLLLLSRILFGGIHWRSPWASHKSAQWRDRWRQMTPEQQQRLRERWREQCQKRP